MSISLVSLSPPYQGQIITVDVSSLQKFTWKGRFELQELFKERGSELENDLSNRVDLIQNTLSMHLPKANEQTKNIIIACLKTAFLCSIIAEQSLAASSFH